VLFGCIWDSLLHYNTQFKTVQTGAKVRAMMSRRNFSQRTHPIHPMGLETHILVCFVLFGCIWDRLVALQNTVQNGLNLCKSSCHEVASEFFSTNAPDPPQRALNSCFGMFCTIWVHLVPFGYLTKLGVKWAEVVQKFVP